METASRTLLLNASFEPLQVISWKRAISMLTRGKVEIVEEYEREIRSVSFVVKMPAVVRLLRFIRWRKSGVKFSRRNIYVRDGFKCQYCSDRFPASDLTYDHVVPRRLGGRTTWENIVTACWPCNARKGGRTPAQARMALRKTPIRPEWLPAVMFSINLRSAPDAWRDYLYWHSELQHE